MALSLEQLLTPVTNAEALQNIIDTLDGLGFDASSWGPTSRQRALIEVWARQNAAFSSDIVNIAKGGFLDLAEGGWLTILAKSAFDVDQQLASKTQGKLLMTCASGSGPYTIDTGANQIVVADTANGYVYRNITGGTLSSGSTLEVTIEAEVAGASRDVASNTITDLRKTLVGVTVNNPIPDGETTWITTNGADDETASELIIRCRAKWATLSGLAPGAAYEFHALTASTSVNRAYVDDQNPRGNSSIDVYLAGTSGEVGSDVISAVDTYIRDGRKPNHVSLLVKSATARPIAVASTIYIESAYNTATNQATIATAIADFFKAVPVSGVKTSTLDPGVVSYALLMKAISNSHSKIINLTLSSPSADVALLTGEVAIPVQTLAFVGV